MSAAETHEPQLSFERLTSDRQFVSDAGESGSAKPVRRVVVSS